MDLSTRAKMHAALGDPVRLAVVDQLALTDRAAGELGQLLEIQSNLLAHHLRVLEEAGLVRRQRSEGDRRRSYVRLRVEDPVVAALVGTQSTVRPSRVLFVCSHNSARSKLADAVWRHASPVPSASAGTRPAARIHPRAQRTARRHHLELVPGTAVLSSVLRPDDLVVCVCDQAHEDLAGTSRPSALHWAVPDPVAADTDSAFEDALTQVQSRVLSLAAAVGHTSES